jgi:hypothetical protein
MAESFENSPVAPAQTGAQMAPDGGLDAGSSAQPRMDSCLHQDDEVTNLPVPVHHNHFSRERQVRFLEALAVWGNVRAACRAASIAPQTAYRQRRACREFSLGWQAALLAARPQVEDVLADRALNGTEEVVWYHGEEAGRRRRYDGRLLLAHLGRLDRIEESAEAAAVVADFDAALERLGRGEGVSPPPPPPPPPKPAPEPRRAGDEEWDEDEGEHGDGDEEDEGWEGEEDWDDEEEDTRTASGHAPGERPAFSLAYEDAFQMTPEEWERFIAEWRKQDDAAGARAQARERDAAGQQDEPEPELEEESGPDCAPDAPDAAGVGFGPDRAADLPRRTHGRGPAVYAL